MNKYIKHVTLLMFIGFFVASPMAFAQEKTLTGFIQNKITERRENIREKLGANLGTPLSAEATTIVNQIVQKFTYASAYMHDMGEYIQSLEQAYTPDADVAISLQFTDAKAALGATIQAMNDYSRYSSKESIADFSALVKSAKESIAIMSKLQLAQVQKLREANVPAQFLSFDTCAFSVEKSGFYIDQPVTNTTLSISFDYKPEACANAWTARGTIFGNATILNMNGTEVKNTSAVILQNTDGAITTLIATPKNILAKGMYVISIEDVNTVQSNSFVIPLRVGNFVK